MNKSPCTYCHEAPPLYQMYWQWTKKIALMYLLTALYKTIDLKNTTQILMYKLVGEKKSKFLQIAVLVCPVLCLFVCLLDVFYFAIFFLFLNFFLLVKIGFFSTLYILIMVSLPPITYLLPTFPPIQILSVCA